MNELRLPNADTQKSIDDRLKRIENGESAISTNITGVEFNGSISAKSKNDLDVPLTAELDNEGLGVLRVVDVGGIAYDNHSDAIKIIPANKTQFEQIYEGSVESVVSLEDIDPKGADSVWVWIHSSATNWTLKCGLDIVGDFEGSSVNVDGVFPKMEAVTNISPKYYRQRGLLVASKSETLEEAVINRIQTPFRLKFENLNDEIITTSIIIERKW